MPSVAFVVPLLPDRAEAQRAALAACWRGERQEAYQDARRRAGITREAVWIQPTALGAVAVVLLEADDLDTALTILATSTEAFDRWFRDHVGRLHPIGWSQGSRLAELVLDFDINRI